MGGQEGRRRCGRRGLPGQRAGPGEQLRLLRGLGEARRHLPSRLVVKNPTDHAFTNVTVTLPSPTGATITDVGAGAHPQRRHRHLGHRLDRGRHRRRPPVTSLVVESEADTLGQDPELVWKDLSSTARLTSRRVAACTSTSHGPKVIPPADGYDTARYGDRPFPVVPVDYLDRKHQDTQHGRQLADVINSPGVSGLDLQPLPGDVAGAAVPQRRRCRPPASRPPTSRDARASSSPSLAARGHLPRRDARRRPPETPLYPERIQDGLYQLPGNTDYYGDDQLRLGDRRLRSRGRRAAGHRLGLRPDRQAGLRRRRDRRPGDRLLRLRHRQGRRRRLLHGRLRRLRRQRRLTALHRRLPLRRRALRQRLAALLVAGVLLHRPRDGPGRVHAPTTSSRTSRATPLYYTDDTYTEMTTSRRPTSR